MAKPSGRRPLDMEALRQSNYASASRDEMERAYKLICGQEVEEDVPDERLRSELQALDGVEKLKHDAAPVLPVVAAVPEGTINPARIPNLSPTGKWGGRMRRVTIHQNTDKDAPENLAVSLGWEGNIWTVQYDVPLDMPWPWWEALKNAVHKDEHSTKVRRWVPGRTDEEMGRMELDPAKKHLVNRKNYRYTDHGDVPGTEHLPISYFDFFQGEARRTGVFSKAQPAVLLRIYSILHDGPPVDRRDGYKPVRLDPTQLRFAIAERLGTEFVDMLNNEVFAVA